ncbi:MAG TPA: DNA-directed RNA polymerase subunit A' [Candidatus Lokiarchaeia archaeon]|nr:DNA-directed RNA polymerase subunit A' [Candidatus Lokiarchaeia archaeon]
MSFHVSKVISRIDFTLLSPEDIRKLSAARIITADTYDEDGLAIPSGLMDPRLGTIEPGRRCATCGNRLGECPGHFGHIELARPVIHVGYAKKILKYLRCICRDCSRIALTKEQSDYYTQKITEHMNLFQVIDEEILKDIYKVCRKAKVCPYCGSERYKIKIEKPTSFLEETPEEGTKPINPKEIRRRFEKIPKEDLWLHGVNPDVTRPEWMILIVLPIPPVCVRPSITLESGIRSEDDLTHKLVDVIRINQRLRENIDAGSPQLIVEDLWELLQYHVTTYFNNEVSGIPPARHRSGRSLRTLTQRLKGKEGRFRSNLSGKRVDFSARTVISPNPYLSINQVGVPREIAKELTVPIKVTEWNIEEMKQLVLNGPDNHPGANYIIRPDGRRIDLRFVQHREMLTDTLKPGFQIERHLKDGDYVLFNRQPSLHRMSIMAHEVKVMNDKTFRLSLCVCPPYNADFDGDEMNLHVPQSEEARAEAKILMRVQEHILSPRFGGPVIGGIQDFISAAYMLTRKESSFTKGETQLLLFAGGIKNKMPKPHHNDPETGEPMYSGKSIFSQLLPETLNMETTSKFCKGKECSAKKMGKCLKENCENDAYVKIVNGNMISGVIDKKTFGAMQPQSILHRITKDYSNEAGRIFLDSAVQMLLVLIVRMGFTMGIDDVSVSKEMANEILQKLGEAEVDVNKYIEAFLAHDEKTLPQQQGHTYEETLENKVQDVLQEAREKSGDMAMDFLGNDKHAVIMTRTGARGNTVNLSQMAAVVGQQSVRNQRINRGYRDRTLPHFHENDLGAEARGFVRSSYIHGLNPTEFFFHAMGGREGLVDTAVRTSTSGYMQRRLINALQDVKCEHDFSVRNAAGHIIQFKYGDDLIDPSKSDHGAAIDIDALVAKAKNLK